MLIGTKQMITSISNLQLNVVIENNPVKQVIVKPLGLLRTSICRGKVTLKIFVRK